MARRFNRKRKGRKRKNFARGRGMPPKIGFRL